MRLFAIVQGNEYEINTTLCPLSKDDEGFWEITLPNGMADVHTMKIQPYGGTGFYRPAQFPLVDGGVLVASRIDFRTGE